MLIGIGLSLSLFWVYAVVGCYDGKGLVGTLWKKISGGAASFM